MKTKTNENRLKIIGEDYKPNTYTSVKDGQPDFINAILELEGIKSIFQAMNFISVDKNSDSNWDDLLPRVTETLEHI